MAFTLQAVVALDGSKFTGGMTGMLASVQRFAGMSMTMFGGVAGQVASMWAAFGPMGGVMAGLKAITTVGITYEKQMSNVQSVSGLSAEAMKKLGDAAMYSAKNTAFTATDAADALYQLASAGLQGADALSATLNPALLLAGATQSDTTASTLLLTSAMAQFQLGAESARDIADQFAGAIASSPAQMGLLTDAFKYAGPAGAAFKMSLEAVNAEIAAFHVVGLRGEMAGTSFRMALIEAQSAAVSGSGKVGQALQGWSAEQEGLTGAIERFEKAGLDGMDLIDAFGKRAGPGMAALLGLGSDAMKKLSERIEENADVGKMYATQMNNVSGRIDLFKSSVEVAAQKIFGVLSPALMQIISTGTLVVDALDKIGPVIAGLVSLIQNYGVVAATWFQTLGSAAQGMIGGLGILGVAVGVLGPIFVGLAKVIAVACISMLKSLLAFITPALVGIAAVAAEFAAFSLVQTVSNVRVGTDTIGGHLSAFFTRVIIFAERDTALIAAQFQMMMLKIRKFILENAPGLIQAFGSFLAPIIEKFGEFRAWILEKLNMDAAAAQVRAASQDMADSLRNINTEDALADVEQAAIRLRFKMDDISSDAAVRLEDALKQAGAAAKENLEGAIEPAELFDSWLEQMDENGVKVKDTLLSLGVDAKDAFNAMISPVTDATDELGALGDAMGKIPKPADDMAVAVGDGVKPVETLTESMANAGKEVLKFGKALLRMDQKHLQEIYLALDEFAGNLALIKLDLGWMRDLAAFKLPQLNQNHVTRFINALKLLARGISETKEIGADLSWGEALIGFKLPQLNQGHVTRFVNALKILARGVKDAGDESPDFGWMKALSDFSLPGTGGFDRFVTALKNFALDLGRIPAPALDWLKTIIDATNLDLQKLIQVADIMAKIPTGTYNASVLIDWKDNYMLGKIEGHLSTLAGLKGVIWA
jgi:TP901 family phage tail tape measure protein